MTYKFLIVLTLIWGALASQPKCSQLQKLTQSQLWNLLRPSIFQTMFINTAGSLSIILLILTLVTWKFYRSFSIPADIMLAICISELLQNSSIFASSIYFQVNHGQQIPHNFHPVCITVGVFYTIGNTSSLLYNLIFCLIVSTSLKKTLKGSLFSQKTYHIIVGVVVVGVTLSLALTHNLGAGFSGLCGYKISNRQSISRFLIQLIICAVCFRCMMQFRRMIPRNGYFRKVAFFGYYYYYMGVFTFIQVFTTVAYMIGNIACRSGQTYQSGLVTFSLLASTIFSVLLAYFICMLRMSHPIVKMKIFKLLYRRRNYSDDDREDDETWLGNLLQSIKGSQIISIISGILIGYAQNEKKIPKSNMNQYHFSKNYMTQINENIVDEFILKRTNQRQSDITSQKLQGLRALDYEVTLFSAQMFVKMLSTQSYSNIFDSFDLSKNIPLIKEKSHFNGGKSGEFLFSTFNHQFIFKTIKEDEAEVYMHKKQQFFQYFEANPQSLITKILGLFRFKRMDISQSPIYIIVMRNISPYDRSTHERIYDIKGSEFNRSTVEEQKISNPEKLRHITLKDLDFKKLEGKVWVEEKSGERMKILLKKDAQFLSRMGVMDYSCLIVKRKFDSQKDHGKKLEKNEIQSSKDSTEYFNIGIIDYLQSWTLKRKAERAFKSLITSKKVTAASPEEYSHRLSSFLEQII